MKGLLLYDFDGVIVDSFSISFGILKEKNSHISEDDYRDCFDGNFYEDGMKSRNDIVWGTVEEFFPRYTKHLLETPPVPGMVDFIANSSLGHTQVIVSSTINSPIRAYLDRYDLSRYFVDVMGADAIASKTRKIKNAIKTFNFDSDKTVFITDTYGDILEANRAAISSIGVTWGFHDRERLAQGEPAILIDQPRDLPAAVRKILE